MKPILLDNLTAKDLVNIQDALELKMGKITVYIEHPSDFNQTFLNDGGYNSNREQLEKLLRETKIIIDKIQDKLLTF